MSDGPHVDEPTPRAARPHRLVAALDPVAEVVAGSLAYGDATIELPDDQPLPGLRVRRDLTAADCTLRIAHHLGDEVLGEGSLTLDRLPLDRPAARPRRRVHPAPRPVIDVRTDPTGDRGHLEVVTGPDGSRTALVPRNGPSPADLRAFARHAADVRLVRLATPLDGDPVLCAALLLRTVAAGTPAWCAAAALADLATLHPELRAALCDPTEAVLDDDLLLARAAADQRRAAWVHHDLELDWDPDGWRPRLRPPRARSVSVVLVTRRPGLVASALAMIAAQQRVDLEVVIALHGGGHPGDVERELATHGLRGSVLEVPTAVPFGAVLGAAVARTGGDLVLKWDDDDLYGPRHVEDLLVAHRQTGAGLVGKAPEFVHLQATGTTIWRTPGRAEAPSLGLAGGTFLTPRAVLDWVGGYPPVARAVDHHLKTRVEAAGLGVFRTHGFGFVLRRHGLGHTWEVDDERYAAKAVRRFDGFPDVLDLGDATRFGPLPGDIMG